MIIEAVLGNIAEEKFSLLPIDYVDLEWYECQKKILRLTSGNGKDIPIRLSEHFRQRGIDDGDVLLVEDNIAIVARILPTTAIVVQPQSSEDTIKFSYEVGNRHAPLFYAKEQHSLVVPYDQPLAALCQKLNLHYELQQRSLLARERISQSAAHGHGHSHETSGEANVQTN